MKCHDIQQLLVAYLDGEITPQEKVNIEAHIGSCEVCENELNDIAAEQRAFREAVEVVCADMTLSGEAKAGIHSRLPIETQPRAGIVERGKSKMIGGLKMLRELISRQPKWRTATVGVILLVLIVALSMVIPSLNGKPNVVLAAEEIARTNEAFTYACTGEGKVTLLQVVEQSDNEATAIFTTEKGNQIAAHVDIKSEEVKKIILKFPGVDVFLPEKKISNPAAGDWAYIYLLAGEEAVRIDGPVLQGEEFFVLENPGVHQTDNGFEVIANSHVSYSVCIDDFEEEIELSEVHMCLEGDTIESAFIFAAAPSGDGVAHNISVKAAIDGIVVDQKNAGSIEVRGEWNVPTEVTISRLSNEESIYLDLKGGNREEIPFMDFAFVVDFNSPVKDMDETGNNTLMVYRRFWSEWADTIVKVYAADRAGEGPDVAFVSPNDHHPDEVAIITEIISEDTIRVSPASGSFPSGSRIVLKLHYGGIELPEGQPIQEGFTAKVLTQ